MPDFPIINLGDDADAADTIVKALETSGFFYVINHGIDNDKVSKAFGTFAEFFNLPEESKKSVARPELSDSSSHNGWLALERERVNSARPPDLKECFHYAPCKPPLLVPSALTLPEFSTTAETFYESCCSLSQRILRLIGQGLELKNPGTVCEHHASLTDYTIASGNTLRALYYPPLPQGGLRPGQIRCGEHCDYGSLTLLFQDSAGGLEVKLPSGDYAPVPPVPGSIIVNIGDIMTRWTADRLTAAEHRVVVPAEGNGGQKPRQSIAFFVHPDDDCVISCLDNSGKYPDITAKDYLAMKLSSTYKF